MARAKKKTPAQAEVSAELHDAVEDEPAPASPLRSRASAATLPARPPSPHKRQRLVAKWTAHVSSAELDHARLALKLRQVEEETEYKIYRREVDELSLLSKRKVRGTRV